MDSGRKWVYSKREEIYSGKELCATGAPKKRWMTYLPMAAMAVCMLLFLLLGRDVEAADLLDLSPRNPWLAALFLVALYAFKSMTVFFPLMVLYLAGGLLFPLPAALLVNLAGLAVCDAVPWLVGRCSAARTLEGLREKYPKLADMERLRQENNLLFALLARAVGVLPGDVVSLYFGAVGMPFGPYLAGSLLGLAPTMVAATIMGDNVSDPLSPAFLIAAGVDVVIVVASLAACRRLLRKKE